MLRSIRRYFFITYKLILFGLSLLLLLPDKIFHLPGTGLDPSYNIGLHLALENGSIFGRDIIFPYGPLGYLHARLPMGVSKTEYLLWDLFFLATFVFILAYLYRTLQSYLSATLAFIALLFFSRGQLTVETLFLPFLFLLFHHQRHSSPFTLALAALFSLILFYVKINTGLVLVILMLAYFIYLYLSPTRHSRRFVATAAALFLGLLGLSAPFLNTDLPGYIWGGIQMIDAYNDAMFIYIKSHPFGLPAVYLALGALIPWGLVFLFNLRYLVQDRDALLRYGYVSVYIFVLFKHAFVRADQHMLFFFQSISLAIGLLAFFSPRFLALQLSGVMALSLVLCLPYATGQYNLQEFAAAAKTLPLRPLLAGTTAHLQAKYEGFGAYLVQVGDPQTPPARVALPERQLPNHFLEKIGRQSVDVIPWEISYIYANGLAYNPRPVFQSYQAYNDYLDRQNRDKYLSATAPDFILFEIDSFDNQHPSFTESKTRLATLTHYQYVADEDDLILLQRRPQPLAYTELPATQGEGRLGQEIPLPQTDDLLMMSFDINYSLAGKLKRTFFQPPPLYVTLKFEDGEEAEYKAIKSVINGQVLANRLIDRTEEAVRLFQEPHNLGRRIVAIRFHSPEPWGFVPEFSYSSWGVRLEEREELR